MKYGFITISLLSCLLCACGVQDRTVYISNDTLVDRQNETVSVPFSSIGISGLSADNAVVKNSDGIEIPSQTVSYANGMQSLIFQADVKACESAAFTVSKGAPEVYDTLVRSRYVPERKDDYAYENNVIVGRIYGNALQSPRTFGPDVWIKNTSRFVFDDWLVRGDFHRNHGEGMDCYMVGNALGGGACAPIVGEKVLAGDNYVEWKRLSNGPLRTEAEFTYPTIDVNGVGVKTFRTLSLDANTRLVHWTTSFETEGVDSLDVFVGAVVHDTVSFELGKNYVSFTEWASDSQLDDPHLDGQISIGVVLSGKFKGEPVVIDGHAGFRLRLASGQTIDYWTASGWDRGGVESPDAWNSYMKSQAYALNHPLKIEIAE